MSERDAEMPCICGSVRVGGTMPCVCPPRRDAEMVGVPVWRYRGFAELWCYAATDNLDAIEDVGEPGRWHAEPVAVAMVEEILAVRALESLHDRRDHERATPEQMTNAYARIYEARKALDAALRGGRNG